MSQKSISLKSSASKSPLQKSKASNHLDKNAWPHMVDVGTKAVTEREAKAMALVLLPAEAKKFLKKDELITSKGSVFQVARIAGIMAAKKCSEWIPLCHPISLSSCSVEMKWQRDNRVRIECIVRATHKTGVEMEALTGASAAALTVYDMCKSLSHGIRIEKIQLISKTGGKVGLPCTRLRVRATGAIPLK